MKEKYINLLREILDNVDNLKRTVGLLLEVALKFSEGSKDRHSTICHAQHFAYLALEELGKYYLILNQYDKDLNSLNFGPKHNGGFGFYDHTNKIDALLEEVKKHRLPNTPPAAWEQKKDDLIKFIRTYKEDSVYIDYIEGKIKKPKANRGEGSLEAYAKTLQAARDMAVEDFNLFVIN